MISVVVKAGSYQDSVTLLALARELRGSPGVREAAALMATPANQALLAQSGLLAGDAEGAGPNDLVIAIRADSEADTERARAKAEAFFSARSRRVASAAGPAPRTLASALRALPGANLALVSVPGAFAAAEARRALLRGLHVMLFSDNVSLADEVALKRLALGRGLLVMGPDCGTAYLNGVPLGFANAVPRGRIGVVAASGTGLQAVATLLADRGEGLSQAVGVGGRDMSDAVGGLMTLAALDALAADPDTDLIVVIGKPPAPGVRQEVEARLRGGGKPAVLALLGPAVETKGDGSLVAVTTLEDAAEAAAARRAGRGWAPRPFTLSTGEVRERVEAARRALRPGQTAVRGLFAGGTLAHEAALILAPLLGPIAGNVSSRPPASGEGHRVMDLGADEFTIGHAHPMLDPAVRSDEIERAGKDPGVAVLLLDVVLGHGAAADPAGDLLPALRSARAEARGHGRTLAIVASVVGTEGDPQGRSKQVSTLEAAGAWVLPSSAQAARAAACIAGDSAVLDRLLAESHR
jgi:FdrA protein